MMKTAIIREQRDGMSAVCRTRPTCPTNRTLLSLLSSVLRFSASPSLRFASPLPALLLALALSVGEGIPPLPAHADPIRVNAGGGANYTTLQAAINAATNGNTIIVEDSAVYSTEYPTIGATTASPLTIRATNATPPTVSNYYFIVQDAVGKTLTIQGFKVTGAGFGLVIGNSVTHADTNLNVTCVDMLFTNISSYSVVCDSSNGITLNLTNCTFTQGGASYGLSLQGPPGGVPVGSVANMNRCIIRTSASANNVLINNSAWTSTWNNCIFIGDPSANQYFVQDPGQTFFYNCTFADTDTDGVAIRAANHTVFVTNCIFYLGNTSLYNVGGATITENYNLFYGYGTTSHVSTAIGANSKIGSSYNPYFQNASANDYHLMGNSAATDAGTTISSVTDDYDGNGRPAGAAYDMGAFEGGSLLTYLNSYVITSSTSVSDSSGSLVDDTEASNTFALAKNQTVLIIYSAHNTNGPSDKANEKEIAISVDGADYANNWDSCFYNAGSYDRPAGLLTFWIGTLDSGMHTVKGRFGSYGGGQPERIDKRYLLIYVFNGSAFGYIDNSTAVGPNQSHSFADDSYASLTVANSGNCKALFMYNTGASQGSAEVDWLGKKIAINLDGTDYSQSQKAPGYSSSAGNHVFTIHYTNYTSIVTNTLKGRFAAHSGGNEGGVTIARRQFGYMLFANSTLADYVNITATDTQVVTTAAHPVDDPAALIQRTSSRTNMILAIAMGTKTNGASSSLYGEAYGIKVDSNYRAESRASSGAANYANKATVAWGETLSNGSHTVQGTFGNNYDGETAKIDSRRLVVLWFPIGATGEEASVSSPTVNNNGGASNVTATTAILNGNLTSTGGAVTIAYFFYGTSDGGAAWGSWGYTNNIGTNDTGLKTNYVSSLSPGTLYYYRFYATNSAGQNWASTASNFTTSAQAPTVNNNGGASNVTATTAILNGNLTSTGGAVTIAYFFYGTSDGGAAWGSWGYTNNIGTNATGLKTNYVSSLSPGTLYYYRFYATNSAGQAWASTASNFTTSSQAPTVDNDGGASNVTATTAILNGNLTSTGGTETIAYFFYGTSDGGAAWGSWGYTNNIGTNTTGFKTNYVSGLTADTVYYYRFYATNSAGQNWASSAESFSSLASTTLPFIETFEDRSLAVWNNQNGWSASPTANAEVTNSIVRRGSKAGDHTNAVVQHSLNGGSSTNIWVDFYARPTRRLPTSVPTPSNNTAAAFYVNTNGYIVALSNSTWLTNTSFTVSTTDWTRFTVFLDYGSDKWSLYAADSVTNKLATSTKIAGNLAFKYTGNSTINRFRISGRESLALGYVDDISVIADVNGTNMPLNIDDNANSVADRWEWAYFGSLADANADTDGDGIINKNEYLAGTNPNDTNSRLRIVSGDISSETSDNVSIGILGGTHSATSSFAGDSIARHYNLLAANNNFTNSKSLVGFVADAFTGTNTYTDSNAANLYASRFYNISVSMAGDGYTNTETWAMFRQNRTASQRYLICVPVDYTNTAQANLNSTLGRQVGRGLYASTTAATNTADYLEYIAANGTWQQFFWVTNAGNVYWYDGGAANVSVTPGMAVWIVRGASAGLWRTNAVFVGKTFTTQTFTNLNIRTNYNGWNMIGWAMPTNKYHRDLGLTSTPSNQLGFENIGSGGVAGDPNRTNELGDQIWVWQSNTWTHTYYLLNNHQASGSNWNFRWWDMDAPHFADFSLEPGMGFFYRHVTNQWTDVGGTNFWWTPR